MSNDFAPCGLCENGTPSDSFEGTICEHDMCTADLPLKVLRTEIEYICGDCVDTYNIHCKLDAP